MSMSPGAAPAVFRPRGNITDANTALLPGMYGVSPTAVDLPPPALFGLAAPDWSGTTPMLVVTRHSVPGSGYEVLTQSFCIEQGGLLARRTATNGFPAPGTWTFQAWQVDNEQNLNWNTLTLGGNFTAFGAPFLNVYRNVGDRVDFQFAAYIANPVGSRTVATLPASASPQAQYRLATAARMDSWGASTYVVASAVHVTYTGAIVIDGTVNAGDLILCRGSFSLSN